MKIKKAFGIIADSFQAWSRNLVLILPFIIQIFFILLVVVPYFVWLIYPAVVEGGVDIENIDAAVAFLQARFTPAVIAVSVFVAILFAAVVIFFLGGVIGMAKDVCEGKKTKVRNAFSYGKKFFLRIAGIFAVSAVIFFVTSWIIDSLFAAVASTVQDDLMQLLLAALLQAIVLVITLFFVPAVYLMVKNGGRVFASLQKSFLVVKRHFFAFAVLNISLSALSFIASLIPIAGGLISILILYPVVNLALMQFVIEADKADSGKPKREK